MPRARVAGNVRAKGRWPTLTSAPQAQQCPQAGEAAPANVALVRLFWSEQLTTTRAASVRGELSVIVLETQGKPSAINPGRGKPPGSSV